MATNRNFIVKQGIQVGTSANVGSFHTSNGYNSNKSDVLIPPSITMDFTKGMIDSRIQCTRASSATVVNSLGKIQVMGNNTPRVEYHPTTGVCMGLVSEETRTNLAWYSDIEGPVGTVPRQMGTAGYADQYPTVSTDVWIGPNKQSCKHIRGSQSFGDTNCGFLTTPNITTLNTWYTLSVYVYVPSGVNFTLATIGMEGPGAQVVGPNVNIDTTIRDKWQRMYYTFAMTSSGAYTLPVVRLDPQGAYLYTDCWQLEMGEYPSTWIPTENVSSATRADDVNYVYPISSFHNPTDFSMYVEATPKWTATLQQQSYYNQYTANGSNRHIIGMDWLSGPVTQYGYTPYNGYAMAYATGASISALYWNSREYGNMTAGAANSGTARGLAIANTGYPFNTMVANTPIKFAATVNVNVSATGANGLANLYANSTFSGVNAYSNNIYVDRITLGNGQQGGVPPLHWGGNIKKFSYFPRSLSQNELYAITET